MALALQFCVRSLHTAQEAQHIRVCPGERGQSGWEPEWVVPRALQTHRVEEATRVCLYGSWRARSNCDTRQNKVRFCQRIHASARPSRVWAVPAGKGDVLARSQSGVLLGPFFPVAKETFHSDRIEPSRPPYLLPTWEPAMHVPQGEDASSEQAAQLIPAPGDGPCCLTEAGSCWASLDRCGHRQ